jgi:hypothetical protein
MNSTAQQSRSQSNIEGNDHAEAATWLSPPSSVA